jgi:PhnB protein
MSRVSTYLNFAGQAEEAFEFYKRVFHTDYLVPIMRFSDMPANPDMPPLGEGEGEMILHAELPILAGHVIMATDMLTSMGHELHIGNNTTINLEPDSLEETQRLYDALAAGSTNETSITETPWGYWGTCLDRFGVRWMFNFNPQG